MSLRDRIYNHLAGLKAQGIKPKMMFVTKRISKMLDREASKCSKSKLPPGSLTYFAGTKVVVGEDLMALRPMIELAIELDSDVQLMLVHDENQFFGEV